MEVLENVEMSTKCKNIYFYLFLPKNEFPNFEGADFLGHVRLVARLVPTDHANKQKNYLLSTYATIRSVIKRTSGWSAYGTTLIIRAQSEQNITVAPIFEVVEPV